MAIKKSELYSTLWKCCDELRGGMDASQYKDYVLVILFVKYISDKSRNDLNFMIDIPAGCHFEDFVALKGHANIGEEMNKKWRLCPKLISWTECLSRISMMKPNSARARIRLKH